MKITLVYNPQAGGASIPVEDLITGLEKRGAEVLAQNTKEEDYEQTLKRDCDFMIIAGGDGTIGKIAGKVMALGKNIPFALLPYGNANNIAGSLDVDTALGTIVDSWHKKDFRDFTVGSIDLGGSAWKFFESVGWGLFAEVLQEVKEEKKSVSQPSPVRKDKVRYGLQKLSVMVQELQPAFYQVFLDEVDHSGYYLWVEVMNTQSMGPQLQLAPDAKHGDRYLDVVLIKENDRGRLEAFLNSQNGESWGNTFDPIKARHIKIRSQQPIHIDDQLHQMDNPGDQWTEIRLLSEPIKILNA